MNADFEELAGRLEGVSRAVLHIAAALETRGLIEGPALSDAWRSALPLPGFETARRTLQELALALDGARMQRRAQAGLCQFDTLSVERTTLNLTQRQADGLQKSARPRLL